MKILFVCTGNTCRSPMAQALAEHLMRDKGVSVQCDSAGIYASPGAPFSPTAKNVLEKEFGILNFDHKAKKVTRELLDEVDRVVAMTEDHKKLLVQAFGAKDKTVTVPGGVGDPYGGDFSVYKKAALQIRSGIDLLWEKGVFHG